MTNLGKPHFHNNIMWSSNLSRNKGCFNVNDNCATKKKADDCSLFAELFHFVPKAISTTSGWEAIKSNSI